MPLKIPKDTHTLESQNFLCISLFLLLFLLAREKKGGGRKCQFFTTARYKDQVSHFTKIWCKVFPHLQHLSHSNGCFYQWSQCCRLRYKTLLFFVHVCNPTQVLLALKGSGLKHSTWATSACWQTQPFNELSCNILFFTTLNSPFYSRDNTVRRQYSYFCLRLRKRSFYSVLFILVNNYFLIHRVKQVRPTELHS